MALKQPQLTRGGVEGFTLSEKSYTLDFSKFTEDTKIQVVYNPETRPYTTERLFQNVEQTDYAVDESKTTTLNAKVGETVTAKSENYPGFTEVKPLDSKVIPVDGTLNLQVKYNRNAYKITYNTDGGSYLTTDTKLFGSKLVKPEAPTKKGYTFLKWVDENGNEFDFTNKTMPAKDITLKAVWTEGENTPYRIAYYVQNAGGDGYTLMGYTTKEGKTGDVVKAPEEKDQDQVIKYSFPGMNFWDYLITAWMKDPTYSSWMTEDIAKANLVKLFFNKAYVYNSEKTSQANDDNKIKGDGSTVVPLYFDRQVYTLIVGGSPDNDPHEQKLTIVKDGITYDNNNPFKIHVRFGEDFTGKMPKQDEIKGLRAGQIIGEHMILGDLTNRKFGWLGDEPPYILDFTKARIDSWDGIGARGDENYPYVLWLYMRPQTNRINLRVHAYYQDTNGKYQENKSEHYEIPLSPGTSFYIAKQRAGFIPDETKMTIVKRGKWNPSEQRYEHPYPPVKLFIIKRDADEKPTPSLGDQVLDSEGNVLYTEQKGYTENSDGEVSVYYKRNKYDIKFHYNYQEADKVVTSNTYFGAKIDEKLPDDATVNKNKPKDLPEEYEFQGWYRDTSFKDNQKVEPGYEMPASNLDLYAKWAPPVGDKTVTIDPDNGTETKDVKVESGKKLDASKAGTPTKAGYDFVAWRVEGSDDNYDFNRPVYKDFTLKAIWKEKTISDVTIKFVNETDNSEVKEPAKVKDLLVGSDYSYEAPDIDKMWPDKIVKGIKVKADSAENVITFKYKPFTKATYSMRFITRTMEDGKDIETEISEATEVTTDKRIDTQNAKDISGYEPQTLQQTLRLAWDQKNVMTFVYKKADPNIAGYQIEYYFDKEGDGNFVLDKTKTKDYSGEVGRNVTLGEEQMPAVMDGLSLNKEKSDQSGIITSKPTLVLKVYYAVNKYTITVDPNGGNWNGNTNNIVEQHKEGSIFTLPKAPVRDGYTFLYWKGSEYNPGDKYTVTEDHTFTAIWEKNPNSNADKKKQSKEVAQTGDNAMAYAYASIIFVAIVGMFALRRVNKKEQ